MKLEASQSFPLGTTPALDEAELSRLLAMAGPVDAKELMRRLISDISGVKAGMAESLLVGDRVAVLKDGVLQQVDTPRALYDDPVNTFVATFIGAPAMNLIDAAVLAIPVPRGTAGPVLVGVRPESWDVALAGTEGELTVRVELVEELGFESFVYATPVEQTAQRIVFRTDRRTAVRPGESLSIVPHLQEVCFFDGQTGERIR